MQTEMLAVLCRQGRPLTASKVQAGLWGSNPRFASPTIYRARTVLVEQGRVHRLEALSDGIAGQGLAHQRAVILANSNDCGSVEEGTAPHSLMSHSHTSRRSGTTPARHVVDVQGHCAACDGGEVSG